MAYLWHIYGISPQFIWPTLAKNMLLRQHNLLQTPLDDLRPVRQALASRQAAETLVPVLWKGHGYDGDDS